MATIDVSARGDHRYTVTVDEDGRATRYQVRVPDRLREELGDPDEERLVRESFGFLLEREPATAILREFDLDVISRYFPEYVSEIRTRLGT
ncbi:MAG: hypothetical protein ACRDN9_16820 [Streptosporangiaceae bacterium]